MDENQHNATQPVIHGPQCPKCKSDKIQAVQSVASKGYSDGAGLTGCCCLGPVGLLCGLLGSGKKTTSLNRVCLNCGHKF